MKKAGGWSAFRQLTEKDKEVYKEAVSRIDIVPMTPQVVAEQVVAGQNYLFMCSSEAAGMAVVMAVYVKPDKEMMVETKDVSLIFQMFDLG